ncbi:hypothetical protein R2281_003875 [Cronobacter dublinensis]|nr:hypothetical protein [Cronobacter dublinensis]
MKLYEMEGFLRGKCVPGDMLANETDAQYLVRKFTELQDRVEVTTLALREKTKQCEQLSAENAALKSAIQTHSESTHFCEVCGKDDPCSTDDVCYALKETPATDAFLREVRAQGVGMFVEDFTAPSVMNNAKFFNEDLADAAKVFAAELREGGAA